MVSSTSTSKLQSSFLLPNLLLKCLNTTLFLLALVSILPILLLRAPPAPLGLPLLAPSALSLASSFAGFFSSHRLCYPAHFAFLLASLGGQVIAFLALLAREGACITLMRSPKDPREAKALVRVEASVLLVMVVLQTAVLAVTWAVHRCWVREYQTLEAEMGRRRRGSRVHVEEEEVVSVCGQGEGLTKIEVIKG